MAVVNSRAGSCAVDYYSREGRWWLLIYDWTIGTPLDWTEASPAGHVLTTLDTPILTCIERSSLPPVCTP